MGFAVWRRAGGSKAEVQIENWNSDDDFSVG